MKIALAQINVHIGHFEGNVARILHALQEAKALGAQLVVFPELVVPAYPPQDFLEFDDFIRRCESSVQDIARECRGIAAIVGSPVRNPRPEGKDLLNAALLLHEGQVVAARHKSLLPNYDIFEEYRYFEPSRDFQVVEFLGERIALTICEDLWDIGDNPLYTVWPMDELIGQHPGLMINISASPYSAGKVTERRGVMQHNARKYRLPLFYVNQVGAQTELLFDGGSMVVCPDGEIYGEMARFEEDLQVYDLEKVRRGIGQPGPPPAEDRIAGIHDALVMGIRDYFGKMGFRKAILGLSGGIDSALTMVLAARALGAEQVRGILLPSEYSSDHSIADARELAERLGCPWELIPIQAAYRSVLETLDPQFHGLPFNLTEENIQARVRAVILMALSNKFGHILLNTSNKSEAAVGYGTLYGDMCGGLSVLGDVYKTEVYALAEYVNRQGELIPRNTLEKPPSAELRPGQKD
ncbi:MAG TPA: NAD+ synthase, partial [Bacteroidales bacterium]|nr:NAD+ synthase [Bacteroidales bacterium]